MQGLTFAAITASEKHTLMLDSTYIIQDSTKNNQSHSSAKSRSRAWGHNARLKSMSRTITMQGLTLAAITVSEKST